MTATPIAYLPLTTYPQAMEDDAVRAAVEAALRLGHGLQAAAFAVDIPPMVSPFGDLIVDASAMVRGAEETSRRECRRLLDLVQSALAGRAALTCASPTALLGTVAEAAAVGARLCDLVLLPWQAGEPPQDLAEALVFGAGRPVVLVPPQGLQGPLQHLAIAWDGSRVAARACGDALALLAPGGQVSVLTVADEKPLPGADPAGALAAALERRGVAATPVRLPLAGQSIAQALQAQAVARGAQMLAMGGFGHSRLRDFILGGATRGVLQDLALPILLAH